MKKTICIIAVLLFCVIVPSIKLMAQEDEVIAFIQAIDKGEIEKIKEFLTTGTDPNLDFHSNTPLMIALWSGNLDTFKLLVDNGALIDKNIDGKDPLINMAAVSGNNEICEYLLGKGVNINKKDREGKTPFLVRLLYGRKNQPGNNKSKTGWATIDKKR